MYRPKASKFWGVKLDVSRVIMHKHGCLLGTFAVEAGLSGFLYVLYELLV